LEVLLEESLEFLVLHMEFASLFHQILPVLQERVLLVEHGVQTVPDAGALDWDVDGVPVLFFVVFAFAAGVIADFVVLFLLEAVFDRGLLAGVLGTGFVVLLALVFVCSLQPLAEHVHDLVTGVVEVLFTALQVRFAFDLEEQHDLLQLLHVGHFEHAQDGGLTFVDVGLVLALFILQPARLGFQQVEQLVEVLLEVLALAVAELLH